MKRFFALILVAICATSCIEDKISTELQIEEEVEVPIMEVEHAGHNYILFEGYGVIHDPNCSCKQISEE